MPSHGIEHLGRVAEWLNVPPWKGGIRKFRIEGSNPSPSARISKKTLSRPTASFFLFRGLNRVPGAAREKYFLREIHTFSKICVYFVFSVPSHGNEHLGRVAEWLNVPPWKGGIRKFRIEGSNPSPSARIREPCLCDKALFLCLFAMTDYRPIPATGSLPAVAVFDLDRTLIATDTTICWTDWLFERGIIKDAAYRRVNEDMVAAYHRGEMDYADYLRGIIPFMNHLEHDRLTALVDEFVLERIAPLVFPEGRARIEDARSRGMSVMIISASWGFLTRPIGKRLFGIEKSFAVEIAEDDAGHLTPEIVGRPPFREGKITKLEEELAKIGRLPAETVFFTDSRNDLPLARLAGDCETVNPDPTLKTAALENGWVINHWQVPTDK